MTDTLGFFALFLICLEGIPNDQSFSAELWKVTNPN